MKMCGRVCTCVHVCVGCVSQPYQTTVFNMLSCIQYLPEYVNDASVVDSNKLCDAELQRGLKPSPLWSSIHYTILSPLNEEEELI